MTAAPIVENAFKKAAEKAPDLQPWPNYFESKAREFNTILQCYPLGNFDSALEIGCGNAFTSVILSEMAAHVVAFDLPRKSPVTHSIGIATARELLKRLGTRNIAVVGGSSEEIPFSAGRFDLIYSAYALHYMTHKDRALGEMRRILADDGVVVLVLPGFMGRVLAPLIKYKYLALRAFFHLSNVARLRRTASPEAAGSAFSDSAPVSKLKSLENWLLLRPDGAYKSFREELVRHLPGSWRALLERSGFRVVSEFSTDVLPLSLFNIAGSNSNNIVMKSIYRVNDMLCNLPILKYIGCSIVFVAKKDN